MYYDANHNIPSYEYVSKVEVPTRGARGNDLSFAVCDASLLMYFVLDSSCSGSSFSVLAEETMRGKQNVLYIRDTTPHSGNGFLFLNYSSSTVEVVRVHRSAARR